MVPVPDARFAPPALPPRYVSRPRLTDALTAATCPLVLLAAGPGAGKTVLLSDWVRGRRRTAWVSLTAAHDDARRFWALFLAAARAAGSPAREVAYFWQPATDPDPARNQDPDGPPVVVLDDAHVLSQPEIVDGLDLVVRRGGSRVRLVLAARSDPLLPLGEYRAAGRLCELRARDLAMTRQEAGQLLATSGVELPERDLEILTERTEGWAAGVRLCALRMEGSPDPRRLLDEVALDRGSIGEFLLEEVLDRQVPSARRLLVETSFLDEVTGPLADAVCDRRDAGATLRSLARRNAFVLAVDSTGTTFRYHPLLREVLRHLLDREPEERRHELSRRAALWYRQRGELLRALTYAAPAADPELTTVLLLHGGLAAAFAAGLPVPVTDLDRLGAAAGSAPTAGGPAVGAERTAALPGPGVPDPELATEVNVAVDVAELLQARACGASADVDAAAGRLFAADRSAGVLQRTPGLPVRVLVAQALARLLRTGPAAARAALSTAGSAAAGADVPPVARVEALAARALLDALALAPRHPDDAQAHALEMLDGERALLSPPALDLGNGWRAYARADYEAASAACTRAAAGARLGGDAGTAAAADVLHADVLTAVGNPSAARDLLQRAAPDVAAGGGLLAAVHARAVADTEVALGRPTSALALLDGLQGGPFWPHVAALAARAHLLLDDLPAAQSCLAAALGDNADVSRVERVAGLLCRAELQVRTGDEGAASDTVRLAGTEAGGVVVHPFQAAGVGVVDLLRRRPDLRAAVPGSAVGHGDLVPPPGQQRPNEPLEPLTDRERAVLRLLPTEMSTADIADELYLSVNTVKTHLGSIYRKLAVSGRGEAVHRARALEVM